MWHPACRRKEAFQIARRITAQNSTRCSFWRAAISGISRDVRSGQHRAPRVGHCGWCRFPRSLRGVAGRVRRRLVVERFDSFKVFQEEIILAFGGSDRYHLVSSSALNSWRFFSSARFFPVRKRQTRFRQEMQGTPSTAEARLGTSTTDPISPGSAAAEQKQQHERHLSLPLPRGQQCGRLGGPPCCIVGSQ